MSNKDDLRKQRKGTIINETSSRQEKALNRAVERIQESLKKLYPSIRLSLDYQWRLKDIVERLRKAFTIVYFSYYFDILSMKPDGGILSLIDKQNKLFPILIAEKKIKALTI